MRNNRFSCTTAAILCACAARTVAVQVESTFNGGFSSNFWNTPQNWTNVGTNNFPTAGNPSGTTYHAVVGTAGGAVTAFVPFAVINLDRLTVNADDTVQIGHPSSNGGHLRLNSTGGAQSLINAGTITFEPNAANTLSFVNAGSWGLSGGGRVIMTNLNSIFAGDNSAGRTVHNLDNLITGHGQITAVGLAFVNSATLEASGGEMRVNSVSAGTPFINNGTMRALAGASLNIIGGGTIENAGGHIIADGGTVIFNSALRINGGTLQTLNGGVIRNQNILTTTLSNLTNEGNFVNSTSNTAIEGTITNNGSINHSVGFLQAAGGGSALLTGSGVTNLSGTGVIGGAGTLHLAQLVRGSGNVGNSGRVVILPGGILEANAGTLFVNGIANGIVNQGIIRSLPGGTINLSGTTFENSAGVVLAQDNSNVVLGGAIITGGTFTTAGSGTISVSQLATATLINARNSGHFRFPPGSTTNLVFAGSMINTGSFNAEATSGAGFFVTGGTVNLTGGGTFHFNGNNAFVVSGAVSTLVTDNFIHGRGQVGANQIALVNNGMMQADLGAGSLAIDPADVATGMLNNMTLRAINASTLTISGPGSGTLGSIMQAPTAVIEAAGGSTLQFISPRIVGGTLRALDSSVMTGNAILKDLTRQGQYFSAASSGFLEIEGTVVNDGTIEMRGSSTLRVAAGNTATLTGGNVLMPTQFGGGQIGGAGTLITDCPIRGTGNIGMGSLSLRSTAPIFVDPGSSTTFASISFVPGAGGIEYASIHGVGNGGIAMAAGAGTTLTGGDILLEGGNVTSNGILLNAGNVTLNNNWAHGSGTLNLGNVTGTGSFQVFSTGVLNASHIRLNRLITNNTSKVNLLPNGTPTGVSVVNTLSISGSPMLNINDNTLIVDYTGASPIKDIRGRIVSGMAGGSWNGVGINSAVAAATPNRAIGFAQASEIGSPPTFDGQAIDSTTVLIKFTLPGDANLDRSVNIADFSLLASNFNSFNTRWNFGDFDYSGSVNIADFSLMASNFGQVLAIDAPRGAGVPEPWVAPVALACSLTRRRRPEADQA